MKRSTLAERFEKHVDRTATPDGCHLWTGSKNWQGYGSIAVDRGGKRWRTEMAHRVAFEIAHGFTPRGIVCHTCDTPSCVRVDHLYDGTYKTNARDRDERFRTDYRAIARTRDTAKGERVGSAKLTTVDVLEIRAKYALGEISQEKLAEQFGVGQSTISSIVKRTRWTHV